MAALFEDQKCDHSNSLVKTIASQTLRAGGPFANPLLYRIKCCECMEQWEWKKDFPTPADWSMVGNFMVETQVAWLGFSEAFKTSAMNSFGGDIGPNGQTAQIMEQHAEQNPQLDAGPESVLRVKLKEKEYLATGFSEAVDASGGASGGASKGGGGHRKHNPGRGSKRRKSKRRTKRRNSKRRKFKRRTKKRRA
jgi:hypothetical protein